MDDSSRDAFPHQTGSGGDRSPVATRSLPPIIQPIPNSAVVYCRFGFRVWGPYEPMVAGRTLPHFRLHAGDLP
jgi:hypothetical protein